MLRQRQASIAPHRLLAPHLSRSTSRNGCTNIPHSLKFPPIQPHHLAPTSSSWRLQVRARSALNAPLTASLTALRRSLNAAEDAEGAGGKRKFKENALTAKAESGTLRVKILRKDQPLGLMLGLAPPTADAKPPGRRKAAAAPVSPDSPPKPRPNRKHVPIFYQQKRRPRDVNSDALLASSSSSSSSVSAVSGDFSGAMAAASTSSTFGSMLSGLQLDSTTGSSTTTSVADLLPPPPASNPLFSRTDSDGLGALSELLRPHFPSATGPSFPLSGSSSGVLHSLPATSLGLGTSKPMAAGSSALHQLASSSQQYQSALDALSTATIQSGSIESQSTASTSSAPSMTTPADEAVKEYKFNPLSALQSAIDHAQQFSQTLATSNVTKHRLQRSASSTSSSPVVPTAQFNGGSTTSDSGIQRLLDDGSDDDALGPPPSAPPPFTIQNSLIGGGIDSLGQCSKPKLPQQNTIDPPPLGPPPSRDLSLLLQNSTDGGDGDLGPPPSAPPAFRIENSLIGGGIETQPTIADVNTHNFDWKFRDAAGKLLRPSDANKSNSKSGPLKTKNEGGNSSTSNESSQESNRGGEVAQI